MQMWAGKALRSDDFQGSTRVSGHAFIEPWLVWRSLQIL